MKRYPCDRVGEEFIDQAPIRFVNSVEIDAAPDQIWAALEDASTWPRWANVITNVEWTSSRPFRVGTTRTVTMRAGIVGYEEFIIWEPYSRMGFRFNESTTPGVRAFGERYTIERLTPSRSRVTWVMAMAPKGVSKLIVPLTKYPMKRGFGRMLKRFGKLVENEFAQPAPIG